ncbi:MAG TPA: pseudaminic acid synthase [Phycisphaerales bacterium]|nr:pseudaminic acid synthase [Phycisphaerales bacterium]
MQMKISNKTIGGGSVFIIAEVSANHGQDFDRAVEMVKAAKDCGADAVKFQAYTPETMTIDVDNKYFMIDHPEWGGQTLYELYKKAYTPWEWFPELKKIADDLGVLFLCTAFDKTSVDVLEKLGIAAHKIASFELVDLPLIEYASKTGKPLIISTGMGSLEEIQEAVDTAKTAGAKEVILLKCVSGYPAKPEEMNLATIPDMRERFGCPVGLSDHSLGIAASVSSIAFGACVIEKHFTLSREKQTPDSFFSIEPDELKQLVNDVRIAEKAIGEIHYGLTESEEESCIFRRSLFVVTDVKAGDIVTDENIRSIRPGQGLKPKHKKNIVGKRFLKDLPMGTPLKPDHLEGGIGE